jgi:eight-cysteine-cluster-containing protein
MTAFQWRHRVMMIVSLVAVPFLIGAEAIGCGGGEVTGGGGEGCVVGGCSSQLCIEPGNDGISTCEWNEAYACYQQQGICERNSNNECGWRQTQALQDCIAAASNPNPMPIRTPVLGPCIRNQPDACTSDADCTTGGCGGEVCHGVGNDVTSTCDCTAPQGISCGCVNGSCSWWQ